MTGSMFLGELNGGFESSLSKRCHWSNIRFVLQEG